MTNLFRGPTVQAGAPPDPEIARKRARARQQKVRKSSEAFIQRQRGLGPILLQAPTLSTGQRR